jgi:class 3 adenylate cyclase
MIREKTIKQQIRALKGVLRQERTKRILEGLKGEIQMDLSVINLDGDVMFGSENPMPHRFPIADNGQEFAFVKSDREQGSLIADLLSALVQKDLEKKRIGNEVLGLYREINMIYDFSEMLAEKIDVDSIAEMTLGEASQIIDSTHGLFLIHDTETDQVVKMSSFGEDPNREQNIILQNKVLKELILRGTSSIVPYERIAANPALSHLRAMMYAPLKVKNKTMGMVILGHNEEREFTAGELKLLTTISLQAAVAIESAQLYQKGLKEAQEREQAIKSIHEISQKFVPTEFIRSLGKDRLTEVSLGDLAEKEVSVLFVDIRGFTALSEKLSPRDNFLFINSFNKKMGPIIRENKGFIMQYLGDGFMALFPGGSQYALRASVQMHVALEEYNREREEKGRSPVKIGIGMQNGDLIMGITGDVERLDAAIISDTVNTASRIEGLSKHFGTSILITGRCRENLTSPDEFDFRYLGPVQVIGKQKPIDLYECINGDAPALLDHKMKTLETFDKGMDLYFNKEFAMAAVTFQQIFKKNREDLTAKLFLNRAAHLITQEIGDDWKGVQSMTTK